MILPQFNPDAALIQAAEFQMKRATRFLSYAKAAPTRHKARQFAFDAMEAAEVAGEMFTDLGFDPTDPNALWLEAETFALSVTL